MLNYNKIQNNTTFGHRLKTVNVLEVTTQRIIQSNGIEGPKNVILKLYDKPFKATGHRGFRFMAETIGKKIVEKYPRIKEATDTINAITAQNPSIKKNDLNKLVTPLINEIGEEVDIII